MGRESPVLQWIEMPGADLTEPSSWSGIFTDILCMNSEYELFGQEVGCGTRTAQIIHDLGTGQLAAT
jgi:hypothetical protein